MQKLLLYKLMDLDIMPYVQSSLHLLAVIERKCNAEQQINCELFTVDERRMADSRGNEEN